MHGISIKKPCRIFFRHGWEIQENGELRIQEFDRDKVVPAVLHVIFLGIAERNQFLFAVAEGFHSGRGNSLFQQIFLRGQSAALSEGAVVFLAAPCIAVAFDHDTGSRVALEIVCDGVKLA